MCFDKTRSTGFRENKSYKRWDNLLTSQHRLFRTGKSRYYFRFYRDCELLKRGGKKQTELEKRANDCVSVICDLLLDIESRFNHACELCHRA